MPHKDIPVSGGNPTPLGMLFPEDRALARYERDLAAAEAAGIEMQKTLARDQLLLREKDDFIRDQKVLIEECRHRFVNCLQMIVGLLSLQSRNESGGEASERLSIAADRVHAIAELHLHLHSMDGTPMVHFKSFLERLCKDHSKMSMPDENLDQSIVVEAIDLIVPTTIGIPLSLIANELVTNAIKHGGQRMTVTLSAAGKGHALSVSNDGPTLPDGFDRTTCKGLGIKLVTSLAEQIGGELRIDRGEGNDGTKFTVVFD
jgi:two-component system, sensor histidine kinase PdtaS